ncbi:MAG: EI24 domain-containing protein [Myxococcota bacterium]|nr:EI24 domain-containing protein [Myxococcota bacterium]
MTERAVVPLLSPSPSPADFFKGAALPFQAAGLILRSPKLRTLAALSGVITFFSIIVLLWLLGTYTDDLLTHFWARPETWYGQALWYLVMVLSFLGLFVIGMNTVPLALQAPIQDPMSEATEELCGGFEPSAFSVGGLAKGVSVGLVHTLTRIVILLAGQLVLVPLNLIPGLGSILWTVASSAWTILWVGAEHLGAPMARHMYPFADVRVALRKRRALTLGFGAAVYLLLWVPVLNLFFVPMAVVGGTLLFRGMREIGAIPPLPAPLRK